MQDFGVNQGLVEELYLRYRENPRSIEEPWRRYFAALEEGNEVAVEHTNGLQEAGFGAPGSAPSRSSARSAANDLQGRVSLLIHAFRSRGHLSAGLDPLDRADREPAPRPQDFGLEDVDRGASFSTDIAGRGTLSLEQIVETLKQAYCGPIGIEFDGIDDANVRAWLQERVEDASFAAAFPHEKKRWMLEKVTAAEVFEQFLHTNYVGAKRFSLEGAESTIPAIESCIESLADLGVRELVIGMAHRGRLNVLANVMRKSLREIFWAFEDGDPEHNRGRGDVKYHQGYSSDRVTAHDKDMHLTLSFNPSHLEWVDPVVEGRVRAKQERRNDGERGFVVPLLIHGDASFIAQGVVAETLNLARLPGYTTGGTLHLVINNQIGFTTSTRDARSSRYATDLTRLLRCPVFHVNGDDIEAVGRVAQLACEFRQKFHQDVVIDLICYRRYGHNESDEPRFTQPQMYQAIDDEPTVRQKYADLLESQNVIEGGFADDLVKAQRDELEAALEKTRGSDFTPPSYSLQGVWKDYCGGRDDEVDRVETGVKHEELLRLMEGLIKVPDGFSINSKIDRLMKQRLERVQGKKPLDWGTAEALAFATLLTGGTRIRISGQDSRRGTFSHRHAAIYDTRTGDTHFPAAHLADEQGRFEVIDSPLSEAGVLGFEYGFSLDSPDALVVWEAQYGDFFNAAQVIVDQFITSSEDKWHRLSGLVLLLPHGFEGGGPEHSSARLERFLAAAAEDNVQVCNLTTPAQFFHCLRRQIVRKFRKPLVIMSPKSLLRHPEATSDVAELTRGMFRRILPEVQVKPSKTHRILLCSGKVYYDLMKAREENQANTVSILRLEQLYPLNKPELEETLAPYADGTPLIWVQEEPWNMGAWYFIHARLPRLLGDRLPLRCVTRPESASPATGSMASHKVEQQELVREALGLEKSS